MEKCAKHTSRVESNNNVGAFPDKGTLPGSPSTCRRAISSLGEPGVRALSTREGARDKRWGRPNARRAISPLILVALVAFATGAHALVPGFSAASMFVSSVPEAAALTSQTITFATLSSRTFGDAPFAIGATASSGLTVSFSSQTASVCTVSGATVTLAAVGTCTIRAAQAGNAAYAAAPNVSRSFSVAPASPTGQTISFLPLGNKSLGMAPFTIGATASSGLPVTFSSLTTPACTVNGTTVTLAAVGTCTILAAQAGNATYAPAPNVSQGFTVIAAGQTSQTVNFAPLGNLTLGAAPFTISATASSGLPVTFASQTTPVCTTSGATVTIVRAGTCTIRAAQPGNVGYTAAPNVDRSFTVATTGAIANFAAAVEYATGTNPFAVAIGDFNSDGNVDIATSNVVDSTVSILLGNGDGTFAPGAVLVAGSYTWQLAVGDFNGDGKADVAVTNLFGYNVMVYLGNGDGTFQPPIIVDAGLAPSGIAAADLNGDGKIDLVVTNQSLGGASPVAGQTVSILLGNGDGTFQAAVPYGTGVSPCDVAVADLDGNGTMDLAVANCGSTATNNISVLFGNGDGTFVPAQSFVTSWNPSAIAIADTNGNGKPDLVVNGTFGSMSVLLGNGDGTFAAAATFVNVDIPTRVVVGDFNADGKLDLAMIDLYTDNVTVFPGNGNGTSFGTKIAFAVGVWPQDIATADFNGDGQPDLVASNAASNTVSVLLNTSSLPVPSTVSAQTGSAQSAAPGAAYATALTAIVRDAGGLPLHGVVVTFRAPSSGASGSFPGGVRIAQVATNATGVATAPLFKANATTGAFSVTASVGALNATFALTNGTATSQAPLFTSGPPANGTFNVPYTYTLTANGAPAPTFTVTSNALPPGLTLLGTTGVISGTPNAGGTFAGMLTATNGVLPNATQGFAMVIAPANQTITFNVLSPKTLGAAPFIIGAGASSGLAVTFGSLTASVCTMSGNTVTLVAPGNCSIQASQAGNANYAAAPSINQSFAVSGGQTSQAITFGALGNQTMGTAPFTISAIASSGLAVSFSSITTAVCTVGGATVTLVAAGTCTIQAVQAGNATYAAATSVLRSFSITVTGQSINFGSIGTQTLGAVPFQISASASSGLTVSFSSLTATVCTVSGSTVTLVATGTCTIRASQTGNVAYAAAPNVDQSFAVNTNASPPSVTLTDPLSTTYFVAPASMRLSATAIAALPGGLIARVDFYDGATLIGSTRFPNVAFYPDTFTFDWTNVPTGVYHVSATAVDNRGVTATSNEIVLNVTPNRPPAVVLAGLANYSSYTTPVTIPLSATATAGDGAITKVEFYVGGTLQGTATSAPYAVTWSNAPPGAYSITAKAYDSLGPSATSSAVNVMVTVGSSAVRFAHASDFAWGHVPMGVAIGDLDRDGKMDVAVATQNSQGITLRGYGNGTFEDRNSPYFGTAGNVWGLAHGDVTGDGILDLLTVGSDGVSVAAGNGDGTFKPRVGYSIGTGGLALVVADFNGDGKADVAATGSTDNSMAILLAKSDGTLGAAISTTLGSNHHGIAAGDFNRDGKVDIILTNGPDRTISILLGNGDGTFQITPPIVTGVFPSYPYNVAVGDFNADGKLDLAITNFFLPTVSILLGRGDGTFAAVVDYPVGARPEGIAIADFNGDTKLDLAVANVDDNTVSILLGNGNGTFQAPANFGVGPGPEHLAAGDLNGDGKPDLVVTSAIGKALAVLINTTAVSTQPPAISSAPPPNGVAGAPYKFTVVASGVPAPAFTVTSGMLPPNLTLQRDGTITGCCMPRDLTYSGVIMASNGVLPNATQAFSITPVGVAQTITWEQLGGSIGGTLILPIYAVATASSGDPVTFTSLTPGVCSVSATDFLGKRSGATVTTLVYAGTCSIRASNAGNSVYLPAPNVDRSLPFNFNLPPTVSMTAPTNGSAYTAVASVALRATAASGFSGGSISKVEFYAGSTLVGTKTSSPYTVTWANVAAGSYALTAKATDNLGASTISASVAIVVRAPAPPSVALTTPAPGAGYALGQGIALTAQANAPGRSLDRVEFYSDSVLISTTRFIGGGSSATANATWNGATAGTHALVAKVFASDGTNAVSSAVSITVSDLAVVLTEPFGGRIFQSPGEIRISAVPAETGGSIAQVDFYGDGALLGTRSIGPYVWVWNGVTAGSHTITARARNATGLTVTSAPVNVTVVNAPTLQLNAGIDGTTIQDDTASIAGTVQGPLNAAVIIGGQLAALSRDGSFFIDNVVLQPGANTLTLVLNTQDGMPITRTISINRSGIAPFRIALEPQQGPAPLTVSMTIENRGHVAFQRIEIDTNDDGTPDRTLTVLDGDETQIDWVYANPGVYTLGVKVFDAGNTVIYAAKRRVRVYDPRESAMLAVDLYNTMLDRLARGNIEGAVGAITNTVRDQYRTIFTDLGPDLPTVIPTLGTVRQVTVIGSLVDILVGRDKADGTYGYNVLVIQDGDGLWRIDGM
jgi:Big-like domain-containing protein/VCBS repeat protein/glucodextranase-like protein/putative Ig domain-containing protein